MSVTTIKRWVDEGKLPAHRTAGGHRKLIMEDVLRLLNGTNLPRADLVRLLPEASAEPDCLSLLAEKLLRAVETGEVDLVRELIVSAFRKGMPVTAIADQLIAPIMREIGKGWLAGRIEVLIEHRSMQAVAAALYEIDSLTRTQVTAGRPVAVGGAPEHDHYLLATLLAKLTLQESGWHAVNLGPHTPFAALRRALDEMKPRLVWLSVTHLADPDRFRTEYREFFRAADERGIPVVIGGQALTDDFRATMPYTSFGDGMTHLATLARTLAARRPIPG